MGATSAQVCQATAVESAQGGQEIDRVDLFPPLHQGIAHDPAGIEGIQDLGKPRIDGLQNIADTAVHSVIDRDRK